ncbi:hypothetical protein GN956_G17751 [Arapaima gigas]
MLHHRQILSSHTPVDGHLLAPGEDMGGASSTVSGTVNNQGSSHANTGNVSNSTGVNVGLVPVVCEVRNASEKPVRIYLHKDRLDLPKLTAKEGSKTCFKEDPSISFKTVPPKGCEMFEVGEGFASVFVQDGSDPRVLCKTIYISTPVPHGRSFIVTRDYEIKLQKEGAGGSWVDEDGTDHRPKSQK